MFPNFLVIEGNIGVGKTSLAQKLSESNDTSLLLERFEENPFLPLFYRDPKRYAFQLELSFMADRYAQMKHFAEIAAMKGERLISDYYFIKSLIFASVTLENDELDLFVRLFEMAQFDLPKPDLFLYLKNEPESLMENISMRGREYESGISHAYLSSIATAYDRYLEKVDFPVLILDVSGFDFVNNQANYDKLVKELFSFTYPKGVSHKIIKV